jgi:hypothetical protein
MAILPRACIAGLVAICSTIQSIILWHFDDLDSGQIEFYAEATSNTDTMIDLTSDDSYDALGSSTSSTAEPEIIDLSSEGAEVLRQPLTPVSPVCEYSQPLIETKGRPKNARRNFLPNAFQIKHDEIYQSATSEIATILRSNQWHYQHMISGMDRVNDLMEQANTDTTQNLLDAKAECQTIDTDYILVYDQATLPETLFDSYLQFCSEKTTLDCRFAHLVRKNTGVLSRLYCAAPDVLMQTAQKWRNDHCLLSDRQDSVTESPRTPVKRRCRSLEPPGAPVKKSRREWWPRSGKASKMRPLD